jgi:hypothetical protein
VTGLKLELLVSERSVGYMCGCYVGSTVVTWIALVAKLLFTTPTVVPSMHER